jgi:hypothetical protein
MGLLLRWFRFCNYEPEQQLFGRAVQYRIPAKFGLANRCSMGILSVSRWQQIVDCSSAITEAKLASSEPQTAPFRMMVGRLILVKNRLFHRKG